MANPSTFFIILTNQCNLNCMHCYANKDGKVMTPEVLQLANDYVVNNINDTNEEEYVVGYTGGEIGLYNQDEILKSVQYIKDKCKGKNIRFSYQTNLIYNLTTKHIKVLNQMNEIGTSYDLFIRYKDMNEYNLWVHNLKALQEAYNDVTLRVSTVVTKYVTELPPESLIRFYKDNNIHTVELLNVMKSLNDRDTSYLMPSNEQLRDWFYETFKLYEKVRRTYDLTIVDFEYVRQSFNSFFVNNYSRECCQKNRCITPDGKVGTCMLTQNNPIYDLVEMKELEPLETLCNNEAVKPNICKDCEYFKYCRGGCQFYNFDETGCTTPYKIYNYLQLEQELYNE